MIETLIYGLILGVFLLVVVQLFVAVKTSNANSVAFGSLQKNFHQVVSDFNQTVKNAENTTLLPGTPATTLSLNSGTIFYELDEGVLKKTEGGEVWDLTTNEVTVSALSFENLTEATQSAIIKIRMDLESNYLLQGGRRLSETLETSVGLRR